MNAKKILHVAHGYFPECHGGTETHVRSLIQKQLEKGLDVSLLHGSFEPRGEAQIVEREDLAWPTHVLHRSDSYSDYWDRAHDPAASRLFRAFLQTHKPDLIHVHHWIRLTDDLCEIAQQERIPTLVFLHDLYSSCPACFRQRPDDSHCERTLTAANCMDCVPLRGHESPREVRMGIDVFAQNMRNELQTAGRVLAATRSTADLVTRGLGLDADLVGLLPLPRVQRFAPDAASSWSPPAEGEALRLAFWGLIAPRKGIRVLLEALRQLGQARPLTDKLELHVLGTVSTQALDQELRESASDLPVIFHGDYRYDQIAALRPHLAVFPSTCFETYGLVLDEACELGLPALVTNIGALSERVGEAGITFPPNNPAALCAILARLLDEPSLLPRMQSHLASTSLDPDRHLERLQEEYERAQEGSIVVGASTAPSAELRLELETLRKVSATPSAPLKRGL